jgi:recombination protein RecR
MYLSNLIGKKIKLFPTAVLTLKQTKGGKNLAKPIIPSEIVQALELLKQIPGIGDRTSTRLFYNLFKLPKNQRLEIIKNLARAVNNLRPCKECFILTNKEVCEICSSPERTKKIITVVEESSDAYTIERLGKYKGVYHILEGRISPLEGVGPENLTIEKLLQRVEKYLPEEVILATNPNTEGEATAAYIGKLLKKKFPQLKITRIGLGAAFGTYLELLEENTLNEAFSSRKDWES